LAGGPDVGRALAQLGLGEQDYWGGLSVGGDLSNSGITKERLFLAGEGVDDSDRCAVAAACNSRHMSRSIFRLSRIRVAPGTVLFLNLHLPLREGITPEKRGK
jgi:hypothetical protein